MADNEKKITPEEAQNIFASQLEQFKLNEEEQALADNLGLNDIDLSEIDPLDNEAFLEVYMISLGKCAELNNGSDYYEQVVRSGFTKYELAAYCLEEIYRHIETGKIDSQMIDVNEKLLCFAENEELINAITCMGLQLSVYNKTKGDKDDVTNQPGTTGEMLNFHDSLATILSMRKEHDKDIQTTIANEIPLIEKEKDFAENLMYIYLGILDRVKTADKSGYDDSDLYKAEFAEISADIVKLHYEFISDIYGQSVETMRTFLTDCMDEELILDENGKYKPDMSVFRLAKYVAFDDVDYTLPGDKERMIVLDIPDTVPEASEQNKPTLEYDADAGNFTVPFYELADTITDEHKRECMIFSCEKSIRYAIDKDEKATQIKYAERLLALDNKNKYFMPLYNQLSLGKLYSTANANNSFYNGYETFDSDLGTQLYRANRTKEERPNGPGLASISLKMKLSFAISAALAVVALLVPLALIETGFETVMKAVFGIIAVVRVIFTGPVALFLAPFIMLVIYFCVMFVLGIVQAFISPVLFIKLILIGIPGGFAIYLYSEISNELRKIKSNFNDLNSARNEYKPIAEKLLKICKERNMPNEMVTYYERMVAEFKKL